MVTAISSLSFMLVSVEPGAARPNRPRKCLDLRLGFSAPTSGKILQWGYRMRHKRAWTMPAEEARTFLQQIQEKIASSDIEVPHRDVLIRLRSIIEEDLEAELERSVGNRQEDQPAS